MLSDKDLVYLCVVFTYALISSDWSVKLAHIYLENIQSQNVNPISLKNWRQVC